MYEGKKAELEMKRVILVGGILESKVFQCKILAYHAEEARVYLLLEEDSLEDILLDAVYEFRIETGRAWYVCEGRIQERYYNEQGKILEFQIENGFYKNSIKSVDKPEVE